MKKLKKYLSVMLAALLCLSLAACGSDSDYDNNDNDGDYLNAGSDAPDSFEGMVKDSLLMVDLYVYGGAWSGEDGSTLIAAANGDGDEVRFELYDADEELTASGYIQSVPDYGYDYFYNEHDGVAYRSWSDEAGALHIASIGTFTHVTGDTPGENIGDEDSDGYGALAGVWFMDANAEARSIITIDESGEWVLAERPDGDGDPVTVDCGAIETNPDGDGRYYAVSAMFDDVVYELTVIGDDVMYWGSENDYYQKMA